MSVYNNKILPTLASCKNTFCYFSCMRPTFVVSLCMFNSFVVVKCSTALGQFSLSVEIAQSQRAIFTITIQHRYGICIDIDIRPI